MDRSRLAELIRKLAYNLVNATQRSGIFTMRFRTRLVRLLGHSLSRDTIIAQGVFFSGDALTTEGVVSINVGCHINACGPIHIANRARLGCGVKLITSTHEMGPPGERAGRTVYLPIRIGEGCWIGAGAIVLPGVSIAPGCMIAAGAVVTKDTQPNGMYAGVPARRVKSLGGHGANSFAERSLARSALRSVTAPATVDAVLSA